MSAIIYSTRPGTSPIEIITSYYIKSKGRFALPVKQLQRAKSLVDDKLDPHCCDDNTSVLELGIKTTGPFLTWFETMLKNIPLKGNIYTLQRLSKKLDKAINCCAS